MPDDRDDIGSILQKVLSADRLQEYNIIRLPLPGEYPGTEYSRSGPLPA